jgi:hypothetical protein
MAKKQGKTGLIVTIIALGLTLVIVSTIVLLHNLNRPEATDEASSTETTQEDTPAETTPDEDVTSEETTPPAVDPATLTSIDIEPLGIAVFYTKGTPGFEYAIKRTADRTEYIEFSSPDLVGTKCTDDGGVFASIIKNPASSEDQTAVSQKKTVGSDVYVLSLAGKNCASNVELLDEYQTAFSNGFSQLQAIE